MKLYLSLSQILHVERNASARTVVVHTVVLSLLLAAAPVSAAGVFVEQNGLVVVEVESEAPLSPWMSETALNGFTGSAYYRMDGNTVQGGSPNGRLSYFIRIENPGTYHLRIHSNKTDPDSTWANDCYTRLVGHADYQGEDTKTYMSGASNQWSWNTMHEWDGQHLQPDYSLSAGVHELQISGRSKNYHADRFVLFKDPVSVGEATDLAKPQSPLEGGLTYHLTVQNGTGSGDYSAAQVVSVRADPPASGMEFSQWSGDVATLADVFAQDTTLVMPDGDITIAAGYENVAAGTIVIECEDMQLDGYSVEDYLIATMDQGTASIPFPGEAGVYRLTVAILQENDGQPSLGVSVGGQQVATIQYELGSSQRDPRDVDLGLVSVHATDRIELAGTRDGDAAARVDKLIFVWESDLEEEAIADGDGGAEEPIDPADGQDAGLDREDGGPDSEQAVDAGVDDGSSDDDGGCACAAHSSQTAGWMGFVLLALAAMVGRPGRIRSGRR